MGGHLLAMAISGAGNQAPTDQLSFQKKHTHTQAQASATSFPDEKAHPRSYDKEDSLTKTRSLAWSILAIQSIGVRKRCLFSEACSCTCVASSVCVSDVSFFHREPA